MCPDCEARRKLAREALINSKISEALGHAVKGVQEIVGIRPKTGQQEVAAKHGDKLAIGQQEAAAKHGDKRATGRKNEESK